MEGRKRKMGSWPLSSRLPSMDSSSRTWSSLSSRLLVVFHQACCSSVKRRNGSLRLPPLVKTLIILLIMELPKHTLLAGTSCLEKCNCYHKSNKLIADCGAMGLTKLPDDPSKAHSDIQIVNLTRNNLGELRKNIFYNAKLVNLQRIYLRKAGLEKIDGQAFYKLVILIELDLASNSLKSIPSSSFESIPNLRYLDLSWNQIEVLPSFAFQHLQHLRRLVLERNQIKSLDEKAFVGLLELEELYLSDNHLSFLGSHSLLPLIKVHSLTLSGNKWICDCRMRQLREYLLMNSRINVPDSPKCNNLNKVWTQIGLNEFLCAPRISPNDSTKIYRTEAGSNLALECTFYVDSGFEFQPMSIRWFWQDRPVLNNSEGVVKPQKFTIYELDADQEENGVKRKLRTSRLEIAFILDHNGGTYRCEAQNEAGTAGHNYTVVVISPSLVSLKKGASPAAAASVESVSSNTNKNVDNSSEVHTVQQTNSVVVGLVLGILFGVFLVLVLFGIVVVVVCRRKQFTRRNNLGTNRVVAIDSELEKLTASTISGSTPSVMPSTAPSIATTIINPVQKPPRLGFTGTPTTPTGIASFKDSFFKTRLQGTPQVWLIKRNNGDSNGILRSDGDGCCETPLPLCDYDFETYSALTANIAEPDLINHPSTYARNHMMSNEEQTSVHSDGTEV